MSRTTRNQILLDVRRRWDSRTMQTSELRPLGSHAVLLGWIADPPLDDGGMPSIVAQAFGHGLSAHGLVVGRWFDATLPSGDFDFLPAPPRGLGRRVIDRLTNRWPADLIATGSPAVATRLFEQGWWMQDQALLVLDPDDEADPAAALHALRTMRDWPAFAFPPPVMALIAPGVDGDTALLAASSEGRLSELLNTLRPSFQAAGLSLPH